MSFQIIAQLSWEPQPQRFELIGSNQILGTYPLIIPQFFKDLINNIKNHPNYRTESGLRGLISGGKNYEPHEWIFLWAIDFKDRPFWILFSRSPEMGGRGAMAAVGPNDFAGFLKEMGKNAINATLSLINDYTKMKSVVIIVSNPKEAKLAKPNSDLQRFKAWVDQLKAQKNVEGLWFPSHEPICPVCNEKMLGIADVRVGFVQMLCPRCGHSSSHRY